jgi:hypothetical protein
MDNAYRQVDYFNFETIPAESKSPGFYFKQAMLLFLILKK